jgi:hypothetical protein
MSKHLELFDTFPIKLSKKTKAKGVMVSDSKKEIKDGYSLICEVNATHSGTLINNRIYPPDSMSKGIRTWTSPYKKPVLVNHDDTKDPVGRVISARYLKTDRGMKIQDEYKPILRESEGYGYQRLTIKVTDPEAIQKVLDGRYETVSVRMSTDHAYCSICNADWSGEDGPCDHIPGSKHEGKLAYMTTGNLSYREISFVNIPADEYAGVKEAILSGDKDALEVNLYANNDSEKVLEDLRTGENLYALLDSDAEKSDDVVAYLIDKSNKAKQINEEEDVKLSELTKDQLQELEVVKTMIQEAVDKATKEIVDASAKGCEDKMKKMKDEIAAEIEDAKKKKKEEMEKEEEDAKKKKEEKKEEGEEEEEDAKKKKKEAEEKEEEDAKKKKEEPKKEGEKEEEEEEEEEEDKKKKKKGSPVPNALPENKGKGKTGGVKHGAGNQSPVGEEPGDASSDVTTLQDENKRILDENVKINSELHKMVAERLYDLKKSLRKADVVGITTPEARNVKIEELAQRSIDSLKDQINDLIVEQTNAHVAGNDGKVIESPAISQSDMTNEVLEDKKKTREGKHDTLTRLFPKAK